MALDLADLARRTAELGGEEALASVSLRRELVVSAGPDGPTAVPRRTFDLMVRLLVRDGGGRIGVAQCSTSTSPAQLASLAEQAHAQAAAGRLDLRPLPDVAVGRPHSSHDAFTAELSPHRGTAAARGAATAAQAELGRTRRSTWTAEHVQLAVARSGGSIVEDERSGVQLVTRVVDEEGRLVGRAQASSAHEGSIDPYTVGTSASPLALPHDRFGSALFLRAEEPIVLLPAALAPLLEALVQAACTGHAHATGRSPWTGRLGEAVAGVAVDVLDAPQHPDTLGRSIDVEGEPATEVALVEDGYAEQVLHDAASAADEGVDPTGHAAALGSSPDGALARNLDLTAGTARSVDALLLPLDRSVVVGAVTSVVTEGPGATRFTAVGRVAYAVERGVPSRLIGDVLLSGDLTDLLAGLEDGTAKPELVATLARLPEHTLATRCPAIQTRGINVLLG